MKNEFNTTIRSRYLRSFLLLTLIYFGQTAPFYHFNHSHKGGSLELESHLIEASIEDSASHDEDHSHSSDHAHIYSKRIDWRLRNTLTLKILKFHDQSLSFATDYISFPPSNFSYLDLETSIFIDEYCASDLIIRGPPLS